MNDHSAGAKTSGKDAADRPMARMLVRAIWAQERNATHAGETKEERNAAWAEVRDALMQKNLAPYARALAVLRKAGAVITPPGPAGGGQSKDGDGEN